MLLSRQTLDRYTAAVHLVQERGRIAFLDAIEGIDWSDETAAINAVVAAMVNVCGISSEAAATLGAAFYNAVRAEELGTAIATGAAESGFASEATEQAVRAMATELVNGDREAFIRSCVSRIGYEVNRSAGESVMSMARRDSREVRFARVPTGSETCRFCLMLASRGFVYSSKRSAGENGHYHANCDCRIVPSFKATSVQGYDPAALYRQWKEGEQN